MMLKKYNDQYSKLTRVFMEKITAANPGANMVFSPYSLIMLLGMAAHATDGKTRTEIKDILAPGLKWEQLEELMAELKKIQKANEQMTSSNAVCVRSDYASTIKKDYCNELDRIFDGRVFASYDIARDVNGWVKEHTKGMIDKILDEKDAKDILATLINAVSFIAEWKKAYEEDQIGEIDFMNADGTENTVPALESTENLYVEDAFFRGFLKPYKDSKYCFMALLPRKEGKEYLQKGLKQVDFNKLYEGIQSRKVYATIPEFECSLTQDMTQICKELGMKDIFEDDADFSNISNADLKASNILHKACIKVDRMGTKAAAVSIMNVIAGSAPCYDEIIDITLDRPFAYAIVHTDTGLPVFAGQVNNL